MTNTDDEKAFGAQDVTSQAMQTARQNWLQLYYNTTATKEKDPCQRIAYTVVQKLVRSIFAEYGADCDSPFYKGVLQALDMVRSQAVQQALTIREAMLAKGFALAADAPANQQFFTLPNAALKKLEEKYVLEHMGALDHAHTNVRVCTSWATTDENVAAFLADVAAL